VEKAVYTQNQTKQPGSDEQGSNDRAGCVHEPAVPELRQPEQLGEGHAGAGERERRAHPRQERALVRQVVSSHALGVLQAHAQH